MKQIEALYSFSLFFSPLFSPLLIEVLMVVIAFISKANSENLLLGIAAQHRGALKGSE